MIREKIKKDLKVAIGKTFPNLRRSLRRSHFRKFGVRLEHPENPVFGDYASNFALENFKLVKNKEVKNPFELAQRIINNFPKRKYLKKVEAISPGFINFHLSESFLQNQLKEILEKKEKYGSSKIDKSTKVIAEFGQPNTHKLPHVGHFRSYALGESIARLLEFAGFNVFRANYQGDVGLHVAKCLLGYQKKGLKQSADLKENIENLQQAYVFGSKMYEKDKRAKKEIDELNTKIYNQDKSIVRLWKKTRQWSLDYYALMNKRLGAAYHRQYFESETARAGKKIVSENLNKIFKKSKGAVIFPGEKYGLHNRVFITAAGHPTYETKDLGLIFLKKADFDYELSLISTASEQSEYFKVVYKAAEMIAPDLARKFVHIPFGLVSLAGAKLSSRKGSIVSIDELLDKTEESLIALMKEKKYSPQQIEKIKDDLTIGATKYSLLKHNPIKNITFNIKESIALEGNSGPYLQYTYARGVSILRRIREKIKSFKQAELTHEKEILILRLLYQFPEKAKEATKNYSPNLVCNYLFELAQAFNNFYEALPVLKAENREIKIARLALVKATTNVLKISLRLLGIKVLEKM